jgi:hypothetical protein
LFVPGYSGISFTIEILKIGNTGNMALIWGVDGHFKEKYPFPAFPRPFIEGSS